MTDDERQRRIDFIPDRQAVFHSELIGLKNTVYQTSQNVDGLALRVDKLALNVDKLADTVQEHAETAEINRQEMRQAVDNLIIANRGARYGARPAFLRQIPSGVKVQT